MLHTPAQLQTWADGWQARFEQSWPDPDPNRLQALFEERADWLERHPCSKTLGTWTQSCAPPRAKWDGTVEQWRPLVEAHFGGLADRALCLIRYESGGDPNALSSAGARGLMQIMPFWADHFGVSRSSLYDPATNLRIARLVYGVQGWWAWNPYKRGLCH